MLMVFEIVQRLWPPPNVGPQVFPEYMAWSLFTTGNLVRSSFSGELQLVQECRLIFNIVSGITVPALPRVPSIHGALWVIQDGDGGALVVTLLVEGGGRTAVPVGTVQKCERLGTCTYPSLQHIHVSVLQFSHRCCHGWRTLPV